MRGVSPNPEIHREKKLINIEIIGKLKNWLLVKKNLGKKTVALLLSIASLSSSAMSQVEGNKLNNLLRRINNILKDKGYSERDLNDIQRLILTTLENRQSQKKEKLSFDPKQMTKEINDPDLIKEFLKQEAYIGMRRDNIAIDAPTRLRLGDLIYIKTQKSFKDINMRWYADVSGLRELKGQRYEIRFVSVRVGVEEKPNVIVEILRDVINDQVSRRVRVRPDIIHETLRRLSERTSTLCTLMIEIEDLQNNSSLVIYSFGVPRKVGPIISAQDRDLMVYEAVTDAFNNLNEYLKEIFPQKKTRPLKVKPSEKSELMIPQEVIAILSES